jgi:hypothetical protein
MPTKLIIRHHTNWIYCQTVQVHVNVLLLHERITSLSSSPDACLLKMQLNLQKISYKLRTPFEQTIPITYSIPLEQNKQIVGHGIMEIESTLKDTIWWRAKAKNPSTRVANRSAWKVAGLFFSGNRSPSSHLFQPPNNSAWKLAT